MNNVTGILFVPKSKGGCFQLGTSVYAVMLFHLGMLFHGPHEDLMYFVFLR